MLNDNKNKLCLINDINQHVTKLEDSSNDSTLLLKEAIQMLKRTSHVVKKSYEITKNHLCKVNPNAKQIQEACDRIEKSRELEKLNVAQILFNIQNKNNDDIVQKIRINLPLVGSHTHPSNKIEMPKCLDMPKPTNGCHYTPREV